eukprot:scaffold57525_cov63-Attheya_sp.AAC.2
MARLAFTCLLTTVCHAMLLQHTTVGAERPAGNGAIMAMRQRLSGFSSFAHYDKAHRTGRFGRRVACEASASGNSGADIMPLPHSCKHVLAILTTPASASDRIANEAILETSVRHVNPKEGRLSVVLRATSSETTANANSHVPTLAQLRTHVSDVYSALWDCALGSDNDPDGFASTGDLLNVVVYPQHLPNAAPEPWIHHRPDLDAICSHDSICGWTSLSSARNARVVAYKDTDSQGRGGLESHVAAINEDRTQNRGLTAVKAIPVDPWPIGASTKDSHADLSGTVVFLEDECEDDRPKHKNSDRTDGEEDNGGLVGGARIPPNSLFQSVAVGGTFDGMHYGHRKLLTLAVSSVDPFTGKLLVGVTADEMLTHKTFSELIPPLKERMAGVLDFLSSLAPGMKNRIKVVPIHDAYGPPGSPENNDFDSLVLSHETLATGVLLNEHRQNVLGIDPLMILCTRRTEAHGMSSTALRRLRSLSSGVSTKTSLKQ